MSEFIVLLLVAFVIVGPKDLPKVARFLGRALKYIKGLIRDVVHTLNLEEEAATVKEVTSTVNQVRETAKEAAGSVVDIKQQAENAMKPQNILNPIKKEILDVQNETKAALSPKRLLSSAQSPAKNKD